MKNFKARTLTSAGALAVIMFGASPALADALPSPSMAGPLAANADPYSVDLGSYLGKVYVGGAISGIGYVQSNATHLAPGDADSFVDLSNGLVWAENTDGWLQFFAAAGAYSFPTVGIPYTDMSQNLTGPKGTRTPFGFIPVAYAKIVGDGSLNGFSIQAGYLPTLIGNEYAFTFQNMNIERGLLWNFEPIFSRGVQVNYASGPLTVSLSWNDGLYTNSWNTMSGLISYAINGGADTFAFNASANLDSHFHAYPKIGGLATNLLNSGEVYDLIYTHTSGPWTISPYLQINTQNNFGSGNGTMIGGAVLTSYSLDDNWKLAARLEYISTDKKVTPMTFTYGPGSNAFTITATPSYQWKWLYARADVSYVTLGSFTSGAGFGGAGTKSDQVRGMLEIGALF